MKLALNSSLDAAAVQEFAGKTIYKRGLDYYCSDKVYHVVFDATNKRLEANVYGNYGDYAVEISPSGRSAFTAFCDCPYEGYPCKHIVAVLLYFINNREELLASSEKARQAEAQLEEELERLSQPELAKLITQLARQQPQVKLEILLRFLPEEEQTVLLFLRLVEEVLRSATKEHSYTSDHIRQLEKLIRLAKTAPPLVSIQVFWRIADRLLQVLDSWNMDSSLEEVAVEMLNKLIELHRQDADLSGMKVLIEDKLQAYYNQGSCLLDLIAKTLGELAKE